MKLLKIAALVAGALGVMGQAHAGLMIDLNGAAGGGSVIDASALDWSQSSMLAKGVQTATDNLLNNNCGTDGSRCQFDVYVHSTLVGYTPDGSQTTTGLNAADFGGGEITFVSKIRLQLTGGTVLGGNTIVQWLTTGEGWLELFYSASKNSDFLEGANFNDGLLIARLEGTSVDVFGTLTSLDSQPTVLLDQNPLTNDPLQIPINDNYGGQQSVNVTGSMGVVEFGLPTVGIDNNFFLTALTGFGLQMSNISVQIPFNTVDPSDCFTLNQSAGSIGGAAVAPNGCAVGNHTDTFMNTQVNPFGYTPLIGVNFGVTAQNNVDAIGQIDPNSTVRGVPIPEPASILLTGLALLGLAGIRRRN